MAMPLGKARSPATWRTEPSGVERDDATRRIAAGEEVERDVVDVGVAATADDDLVSAVAQVAQVGVYDHEWTRTSGGP
jgi:hypothetical protein